MSEEDKYPVNYRYPIHEHVVIDTESNVLSFPRISSQKCQHIAVEIDSKALELTCKACGVKVNPVIWIKDYLSYFKSIQNQIIEQREKLKEDEVELQKRSRTRCQHCRKMTAINLKHHKFVVV